MIKAIVGITHWALIIIAGLSTAGFLVGMVFPKLAALSFITICFAALGLFITTIILDFTKNA